MNNFISSKKISETMFDFGLEIVNKVSDSIIKLSLEESLGDAVGTVGAGGDLTKIADEHSELIVKNLAESFILKNSSYKIVLISEEVGLMTFGREDAKEGFFIILDPLDGSNNLRSWRTPCPFVSISIALGSINSLNDNDNCSAVEVGIVRDIFNKRTYWAKKGEGAYVEGYGRIKTSPLTDVLEAIIGVDTDIQDDKFDSLNKKLSNILRDVKCKRRLGSSILDMVKVACGEYDAFISLAGRMKIHDIFAVQLIIKEAGGIFELLDDASQECLIKQIIFTKDNSLINTNRFKVLVSANNILHEKIKSLMIK